MYIPKEGDILIKKIANFRILLVCDCKLDFGFFYARGICVINDKTVANSIASKRCFDLRDYHIIKLDEDL